MREYKVFHIPPGFMVGCREEVWALVEIDGESRRAVAQFPDKVEAERFAEYLTKLSDEVVNLRFRMSRLEK